MQSGITITDYHMTITWLLHDYHMPPSHTCTNCNSFSRTCWWVSTMRMWLHYWEEMAVPLHLQFPWWYSRWWSALQLWLYGLYSVGTRSVETGSQNRQLRGQTLRMEGCWSFPCENHPLVLSWKPNSGFWLKRGTLHMVQSDWLFEIWVFHSYWSLFHFH